MAHSLEHFEPAGHLRKMPVPEEQIPEDQRIPRITCATWKYESGAVGSLTHAVALHGFNYSTELDVRCVWRFADSEQPLTIAAFLTRSMPMATVFASWT